MKKKIYFAGSIRGGRNFADLYRKMIEHMQLTDIVLTEHIGQADINLMEKGRMSDAGKEILLEIEGEHKTMTPPLFHGNII